MGDTSLKELKVKGIDKRHYICILIITALIIMSAFCFRGSFWRLVESCRDFGLSIAFYFCELLGIENNITPTVLNLPSLPNLEPVITPTPDISTGVIPFERDLFDIKMKIWGKTLINGETYGRFFGGIGNGIANAVTATMLLLPFVCLIIGLIYVLGRRIKGQTNNDYGCETVALRIFKQITWVIYEPIKRQIKALYGFLRDHKRYIMVILVIWLYNFNIITVGIEAVAYAFYFVSSFDIRSMYMQFYKLFIDLSLFFTLTPLWSLSLIYFINKWRKRIGYNRLRHNEMKNRGFINARPIVVMLLGLMGAGKTAMATDMALSQSAIFRDKCLEILIKLDTAFPYFKWINLEQDIRKAMVEHKIFNLPTCRKYIREKRAEYFANPTLENIYDYEDYRYGGITDDGLKELEIWDVIEVYAQIYSTYVMDTSYIISNYAIRDDSIMRDRGNLPIWDIDFFRDVKEQLTTSKYSHVLDFDALRFGKKMIKNNKYSDTFAFCAVWVISEGGKERGNQYDTKKLDKDAEEANRLNDLFNTALKLIRHPSTIDNVPFARVIMDEQRPESWGADGRELADLIYIREKEPIKLAMPCFWIEEIIYAILAPKFERKYLDYRERRGDMTLPMYLYKTVCAKFLNYYRKQYNLYGYNVMRLEIERGTKDSGYTEHKYYMSIKKTFANRYSTDVYRDYFDKRAEKVECGLIDYPEYTGVRVTDEEFTSQHSHFYEELKRLSGTQDVKDKPKKQ